MDGLERVLGQVEVLLRGQGGDTAPSYRSSLTHLCTRGSLPSMAN